MTQEKLANHIGVTFQQVQKYEKGKDRIPLYALVCLADYLEVPLSQFLAPSASDSEFRSLAEKFSSREFRSLIEAWGSIKDPSARAALINLVASAQFVFAGLIDWPKTGLMTAGALVGYFVGSYFSQRIPQPRMRQLIPAIGVAIASWTFYKEFLR